MAEKTADSDLLLGQAIGPAAGEAGHVLEEGVGLAGGVVVEVTSADADRIDGHGAALERALQGGRQHPTDGVVAVGEQHHGRSPVARAKAAQRRVDRVSQRGVAAGGDGGERGEQLLRTVGVEVQDAPLLVEEDHQQVASVGDVRQKARRRLLGQAQALEHALAGVDQQGQVQREVGIDRRVVGPGAHRNGMLAAVLSDHEIAGGEAGDRLTA